MQPTPDNPRTPPWLAATLGLGLLSLVVALVAVIAEVPFRDWSGARLAWSAALVHGHGLYSGPDSGAVLSSIYGPVSPLLFSIALVFRDITAAMLAGCALNVLCVVGPLWLLACGRAAGGRSAWGVLVFLAAVASVLVVPSTRNLTHNIHVDGAAVGFGLLACLALCGRDRPTPRQLSVAAVMTALAVWTKQVEITLVLAQGIYLAWGFGREVLLSFLVRCAVCGVGLGLLFVFLFGFDGMLFHLWTIPRSQPMANLVGLHPEPSFTPPGFRLIATELVLWSAPFLVWIGVLQWATPRAERRWIRRDWALLLLVAAVLLPTSVLARAKVGGWINSYHAHYFVIAAAALATVQYARSSFASPRVTRRVLPILLVASIAAFWCPVHLKGLKRLPNLGDNPQAQAYAFAVAHPGEVWFPWTPLATLMAEGELYHFAWAIVDRDISGNRMSNAHLKAHLPPRLRWVAHQKAGHAVSFLPRYLPEFDGETELEELPGWTVLRR